MANAYDDDGMEEVPPSWWGAEVKNDGKPVPYVPPPIEAKLHLSQVCMGPGTEEHARAYLRCKVQDGPPLVIAALREGSCENVSVDLVYDEYTEFSVEGAAPLHISGYIMYMNDEEDEEGPGRYMTEGEEGEEDSDEDEPYSPEEVAALRRMLKQSGPTEDDDDSDDELDSDDEDDSDEEPRLIPMDAEGMDEDTDDEEDDSEDDGEFETDDDSEDADHETVEVTAAHGKSTVVIEEIPSDAPEPAEAATQKRKADAAAMEQPQSGKKHKQEQQQQKQQQDQAAAPAAGQTPAEGGKSQPKAEKKAAKAAEKAAAKSADKSDKVAGSQGKETTPAAASTERKTPAKTPAGSEAASKQQKSAAKQQQQQQQPTPTSTAADTLLNGTPKSGKKGVRKFPNGLQIENVAMGQPDGKLAKAGKRVKMKYVGRLASNGKIFDQTRGNKAFAFRLGVGEVISGWDKGIEGMRVGDKRKLTIPPSMGYGAAGAPPDIPPNATLVFDVELVNVM